MSIWDFRQIGELHYVRKPLQSLYTHLTYSVNKHGGLARSEYRKKMETMYDSSKKLRMFSMKKKLFYQIKFRREFIEVKGYFKGILEGL